MPLLGEGRAFPSALWRPPVPATALGKLVIGYGVDNAESRALVISDESEAHDLMASDRYSILLSISFPK